MIIKIEKIHGGIKMENYKEIIEYLSHNKDFYEAVQKIVNKTVSDEWINTFKEWKKLRSEYASLLKEIREVKEDEIKIEYGSSLRYKIAKWLIK